MKKTIFVTLLAATGVASATPLACLIEPEKVAEIGSPGIGIIERIPVERGDHVKAGQVLAYLKADIERASVSVASARATAEAELKAASAAYDLAQAKAARARSLVNVGFISKEALDQAEAESRIAQNRVVQAREARRVARQELALTSSQLAERSIRSPFSGIVIDRYRTEGERVEREPIVRVAKVDPLRVETVLPVSQYGEIKVGAEVMIHTDVTGEKNLKAKVALVDRVIDAASNTFRVRLTLPNPDRSIPPGLRCTAEFGPAPAQALSRKPHEPGDAHAKIPVAAASQPEDVGIVRVSKFGKLSYRLQHPPVGR